MTVTATALAGRSLLVLHRDKMVSILTSRFGASQEHAELRVDQLWDRWVKRMTGETGVSVGYAEQALDAAIVFLAGKGHGPNAGRSPDQVADDGWHLMLAHDTGAYAAMTIALTGQRVEHHPYDVAGISTGGGCDDNCHNGSCG